jgi:hypothetical protein
VAVAVWSLLRMELPVSLHDDLPEPLCESVRTAMRRRRSDQHTYLDCWSSDVFWGKLGEVPFSAGSWKYIRVISHSAQYLLKTTSHSERAHSKMILYKNELIKQEWAKHRGGSGSLKSSLNDSQACYLTHVWEVRPFSRAVALLHTVVRI